MKKTLLITLFVCVSGLLQSNLSFAQAKFTLTKAGIGELKMGMATSKIPAKIEGLYDKFEKVEEEDMGDMYTICKFYLGGKLVAQADENPNNTLGNLIVYASNVSTPDGIHPGMPMSKVITMAGIEYTYHEGYAIHLNNFSGSFEGLNATGQRKAASAYQTGKKLLLTAADFVPTAKIISIAYVGG